jgi:hypothetical protein
MASIGQKRTLKLADFTSETNVVFLAISPNGLKDALREAARSGATVWCGAGAVSERDFDALKVPRLTRFDYLIEERDPLALADALDTIDQHHPGEVVWVEAAASKR